MTQNISESFNRKRNVCSIFFDISKAFDKVWHLGLLYKMYMMEIPEYLIKWTEEFLKNRTFRVIVSGSLSEPNPITAQGAVVSPKLSNI
jgi:hypothetical protein